jgi:hypothetical protein
VGTLRRAKVKEKPPPLFTGEGLAEAEEAVVKALSGIALEGRGAEEEKAVGRTDDADDKIDEALADAELRAEALLTVTGVGRAEAETTPVLAHAVGAANTVETTVTVTIPSFPITTVGVATAGEEVTTADAADEGEAEAVGRGLEGSSAKVDGSLTT